jgi:hypothetical protein
MLHFLNVFDILTLFEKYVLQILMALAMKIIVMSDVTPSSVVECFPKCALQTLPRRSVDTIS